MFQARLRMSLTWVAAPGFCFATAMPPKRTPGRRRRSGALHAGDVARAKPFDGLGTPSSAQGMVPGNSRDPFRSDKRFDLIIMTWTAHPFIAPDESYLIWDSEREGGFGESDLYISFRQDDGSWGLCHQYGRSRETPINGTPLPALRLMGSIYSSIEALTPTMTMSTSTGSTRASLRRSGPIRYPDENLCTSECIGTIRAGGDRRRHSFGQNSRSRKG